MMQTFEYTAWDENGSCQTGVKQAGTEQEVMSFLRDEQMVPVSIKAIRGKSQSNQSLSGSYKKVGSGELATFCWQLSTMLDGGLSITMAIETIAEEMQNKYFEFVLKDITESISRGETFSECVNRYPKVFNPLGRAMIQAGEVGGTLTAVLGRLGEYYENKDRLTRKVRGALAYPIFVVVFIIAIVIVLMTLIIPRFETMFEEFNGELPMFTKGFMAIYYGIMHNLPYILIASVLVVVGLIVWGRTKSGHRKLCQFVLKVPIFGPIQVMAFVSMFCKTLGTLVSAGVSVMDAFKILSGMTGNDILRQGVLDTRDKIVEGMTISKSMELAGFFPKVSVKMAKIGEDSGSLSAVLEKTSEYYEKKVEGLISTLLGMLEPCLIISVGAIVLVVILAMYLPIFSMSV